MLSSYTPSNTLLYVRLSSAKQYFPPWSLVDGLCLVSIFMYAFICANSFVVEIECRIFFVSYSCSMR